MTPHLAATKYLVGIDFSVGSERALLQAVRLAEQNNAQLELVHVFEWDTDGAIRGNPTLSKEPAGGRLWQAVNAQAKVYLRRLAELCSERVADRVPAEIRVLIGDPAVGVLKAAEQVSPALIFLGELGRSKVGTIAERVREKSPVPVLVVPFTN